MKTLLEKTKIERTAKNKLIQKIYVQEVSMIEHEPCSRTILFSDGNTLRIELPYVQFYRSETKETHEIITNDNHKSVDITKIDPKISLTLKPFSTIKSAEEVYFVPLPNTGGLDVCLGGDWAGHREAERRLDKLGKNNKYRSDVVSDCTYFWTIPFTFELLDNLGMEEGDDDAVIAMVDESFRGMYYTSNHARGSAANFLDSIIETLHKQNQ
jgi:hypothetical protein